MGYNSACVRDFCDIFAPIGGFRRWAIECCQSHFPPTDPRCHGNEILNKIGYNSPCVRNICEIFASRGVCRDGPLNAMLPVAFSPTDIRCHGNEIWDKIGYKSACVRDICEIFESIWGFSGMCQRMLPIEFYPD